MNYIQHQNIKKVLNLIKNQGLTTFTKRRRTSAVFRIKIHTTLDSDPFTQWSLSGENKVLYGRIVVYLSQSAVWENSCLYITRAVELLEKVYNSLKLRCQSFLINYVGILVYCNLKLESQTSLSTIQILIYTFSREVE